MPFVNKLIQGTDVTISPFARTKAGKDVMAAEPLARAMNIPATVKSCYPHSSSFVNAAEAGITDVLERLARKYDRESSGRRGNSGEECKPHLPSAFGNSNE
jgi:hypothetical protein